MNDRQFQILLALLQSGAYDHEFKNFRGMENRVERDKAACRAVVAVCVHLDRALADIEAQELMNADISAKCEKSDDGYHGIKEPNGSCVFCGKRWNGYQWK